MLCALDFLGGCFFVFNSLQAVAVFLLFGLLLFRFFFVLWGSGLGGLLITFFYTVPFLEIEYPCAKFFFCLLYSTTVLKYDCIVGTVTEQLFYQCPLLRSCVPLKTEPLLNTNKIKPLVFKTSSFHSDEAQSPLYTRRCQLPTIITSPKFATIWSL